MIDDLEEITRALFDIGAIKISPDKPFTFSSGLLSPVYTDNRLICSYPDTRKFITDLFIETMRFHELRFDVIAGVATAGIPHAAWLAAALNLPLVYVRSAAEKHGQGKLIEGSLFSTSTRPRVLLLEDTVTTGKSALSAVDTIRLAGGDVRECFCISAYLFAGTAARFLNRGVNLYTLCAFYSLIVTAQKLGYITEDQFQVLKDWYDSPHNFGYTGVQPIPEQ